MTSNPMTLTADQVQLSLDLGVGYLLRQQRSDGVFNYEYNWKEKAYSADDNPVRQAGTLWGLSLAYQHEHNANVLAACIRGLEYFEQRSHLTSAGGRFVRYPGAKHGLLGTVALLALTLIELIRSKSSEEIHGRQLQTTLDQYLRFLLDSRNRRGLWHSRYDQRDGRAYGEPSAYFDGEALLALTKAAKYLNYGHLRDDVLKAAATGYRHNILLALNSAKTKKTIAAGYYQWGMMSFSEIIDSPWPDVDQYIEPVFYLGDMRIRSRASKNNPGAILEGLMHAYSVATEKDERRAEFYRDRINRDLVNMMSLQVCSPSAHEFMSGAESDAAAVGGFQHYPDKPTLRIDVTQHSLHALLLGIRNADLVD